MRVPKLSRWVILWTCLFSFIGALAGAPDAHAQATDPTIARDLAAAQAYWGGGLPPQCSRVDVFVYQGPTPTSWASAAEGGCAVALDPDFYPRPASVDPAYWDAAMCSVVAHEWGHLLGYGHSPDPNNIMHPFTPLNIVPGCPVYEAPSAPAAGRRHKARQLRLRDIIRGASRLTMTKTTHRIGLARRR